MARGQTESLEKEKEMDFSFFFSMFDENINNIDKLKGIIQLVHGTWEINSYFQSDSLFALELIFTFI